MLFVQIKSATAYLRRPFHKEPDFAVTSVNYDWVELWQQGTEPFENNYLPC
jgi:hypothetical protein